MQRSPAPAAATRPRHNAATAVALYAGAFVTGAIVMGFEMLGSRYLNPYFGSGIYTWAALISTVLIALTTGYFIGGWLADRSPSPRCSHSRCWPDRCICSCSRALPGQVLELVLAQHRRRARRQPHRGARDHVLSGACVWACIPRSRYACCCHSAQHSGRVSGAVYGVSTAGSIVGTLGTTFLLIPAIGARAITLTLGTARGAHELGAARPRRLPRSATIVVVLAGRPVAPATAESLLDEGVRAAMLGRADGRLARIETEYNDIFITKRQNQLVMSFQIKGWDYTESVANLLDPDDLPLRYAQVMTIATVYPPTPKRILMLGLGGGTISGPISAASCPTSP